MTERINTRTRIACVIAAVVLAIGLTPTAAFAQEEEPLVATLVSATESPSSLAQSLHAFIDFDAAKVYAAAARANGDEEEAAAIEMQAAAAAQAAETGVYEDAPTEVAVLEGVAPAIADTAAPATDENAAIATPAAEQAPVANTIKIGSSVIPFVQYYLAPTAPDDMAGLWWGDSSTTDDGLGYFIGHNPGVFAPVVSLDYGDPATVTDGNGDSHTYTVIDIFDVPNTTTLQDIQARITGHGESIVMQACIQGGAFYRVVVAA